MYAWTGGDKPADVGAGVKALVDKGFTAFKMNGTAEMAIVDSHAKVDEAVAVADLTPRALPALLWFLAAYALANVTAFAVVAHLRGRTRRADFAGLARTRPAMAAALIVAFLSLVGIPPLIGFVGKLGLFIAAIEAGYAWLALAAVLNTVASLFYYARVIGPMYFAAPADPRPATLTPASGAVAVLCAAAVIGLGLFSGPFLAEAGGVAALP